MTNAVVRSWVLFYLLSYTFWMLSFCMSNSNVLTVVISLLFSFRSHWLFIHFRWTRYYVRWNELLFLKIDGPDRRATDDKAFHTFCTYIVHFYANNLPMFNTMRFTWNQQPQVMKKKPITLLFHQFKSKPNQGKYNTMTNEPSVKQQHTRPNWCLCERKANWHTIFHSVQDFPVPWHDNVFDYVCVCDCVCAFKLWNTFVFELWYSSTHKYAMDIIELAIKRRATYIFKSSYSMHGGYMNALIYLLIFLCVRPRADEKKHILHIYAGALWSLLTYTTIPL